MATKTIIGIVGMSASGKSTVAEQMSKKKGVDRIYLGQFIWDFLRKRGIKPTEEAGVMAGLYMWIEYADIPLVSWILKKIAKSKSTISILDSIRTVDEAQVFKQKFKDNFYIVATLASPKSRLQREQKRARLGKVSYAEFKMRDRADLAMGTGDLIAMADYYIDCSKTRGFMESQADKLIKAIKHK